MSRGRRPPLALALRACFHARCALRACFPGRMCDRPFRRVRAKGGLRGGGVARGRMASHARFAIPSLPSRPHASPCRPRFSLGRGQWRNILYVRRRVRIRPGKGAQQERTKYRRGAQRGSRDAGCTQARPALARGARPGPLPSPSRGVVAPGREENVGPRWNSGPRWDLDQLEPSRGEYPGRLPGEKKPWGGGSC